MQYSAAHATSAFAAWAAFFSCVLLTGCIEYDPTLDPCEICGKLDEDEIDACLYEVGLIQEEDCGGPWFY